MKMKRILSLVLMAMLLCLPVMAMAEDVCPFTVRDANGDMVTPVADGDVSWNDNYLFIRRSGLTVSGGSLESSISILCEGNVTLENVTVSDTEYTPIAIAVEATPVTLIFKGENNLTSTQFGILYLGNINIQMVENSKLTIKAQEPIGDATGYPNVAPVSAADIASGSGTIIINGEMVYQYPKPVSNALPQTGDDSNVILWSALACISVIGMMTLIRKRKEA